MKAFGHLLLRIGRFAGKTLTKNVQTLEESTTCIIWIVGMYALVYNCTELDCMNRRCLRIGF